MTFVEQGQLNKNNWERNVRKFVIGSFIRLQNQLKCIPKRARANVGNRKFIIQEWRHYKQTNFLWTSVEQINRQAIHSKSDQFEKNWLILQTE